MVEDWLEEALAVFPNGHRKAEKLRKLRIHLMSLPDPPAKALEKLDHEVYVFLLDTYFTDIGGEG